MPGMPMGGGGSAGLHAGGQTPMTGGSMSFAGILPEWLAIVWTLAFLVVVGAHCHHLLGTRGQRRAWHCVHVAMALTMALMYAPASLLSRGGGVWRGAFAGGAVVVVAWTLTQLTAWAINGLWLLAAADLAAMTYMWSPDGAVGPISWALVAYFVAQAALWAATSCRRRDERLRIGGSPATSVMADGSPGVVVRTAATPLMSRLELPASMITMTLGMAYMLAAMQLLR